MPRKEIKTNKKNIRKADNSKNQENNFNFPLNNNALINDDLFQNLEKNEINENKIQDINEKDKQGINENSLDEEEEEEKEEEDKEENIKDKNDLLKKENNEIKGEIKKEKCSLNEHKDVDAIYFCQKCQIYMCNNCEKIHSGLLKNPFSYKIDINNNNDIFTGICKEINHSMKLEYFCKTHNQLCCAACIAKIRCKGNGKHNNCKIFYVNKIKKRKHNKLNDNIKHLEELLSNLEKSINELKKLFENINKNKEDLKIEIQKIFTKIRNSINDREDQLSFEVDKNLMNFFLKKN